MRLRRRPPIAYATIYWNDKHRRWHMLGTRIRFSREAADLDTVQWREYDSHYSDYSGARTVALVHPPKPRWTPRAVLNQILVWCSWVRS